MKIKGAAQLAGPTGTLQKERKIAAFSPTFVLPDERDLCDMVYLVWDIAGSIHFFEQHDLPPCSWQELLEKDPIITLAVIAVQPLQNVLVFLNIQSSRKEYDSHAGDNSRKECLRALQELQLKCDRWTGMLAYFQFQNCERDALNSIHDLQPAVEKLKTNLSLADSLLSDTDDKDEKSDGFKSALESVVSTCISVQKQAKLLFELNLSQAGNWAAHTGLIFTFLELFNNNQQQLNDVTARHLDHYFHKILKFAPKSAQPDMAVIRGIPVDGKRTAAISVPEGTEFSAGPDATGVEQIYRLDYGCSITAAELGQVVSISSEKKDDGCRVAYIGRCAGDLLTAGLAPAGDEKQNSGWPIWGASSQPLWCSGFGVMTPVLRLPAVERDIELNILFSFPDDCDDGYVNRWWETLHSQLPDDRDSVSDSFVLNPDIFSVKFTGDSGWVQEQVTSISVSDFTLMNDHDASNGDLSSGLISINCHIPADSGEIVDFNTELHGEELGNFMPESDPIFPVIFLRANALDHPVIQHLFGRIVVDDLNVAVDVRNINDLEIITPNGTEKSDQPFMPFGPSPVDGSWFEMALPEAFQEFGTKVHVQWMWQDAPKNFALYYETYGRWCDPVLTPLAKHAESWKAFGKKLYIEGSDSNSLDISSRPGLNNDEHSFPELAESETHDVDDSKELSDEVEGLRSLRFQISADADLGECVTDYDLFGHKRYPFVLADELARRNAGWSIFGLRIPFFWRKKSAREIPPPYTPVMSDLLVSYSASHSLTDDMSLLWFQEQPLGCAWCVKDQDSLLYQPQDDGTLYLGFSGVHPPQPLYLYCRFVEYLFSASEFAPFNEEVDLEWSYLAGKEWKRLSPKFITNDTTKGLQQSGLLTIQLPADATDQHGVVDGLVWLRITTPERIAAPRLYRMFTNAMPLTFLPQENDPARIPELPADSINRSLEEIPGILRIEQPYSTFGGIPEETSERCFLRASERLRHKERAIIPWIMSTLRLNTFLNWCGLCVCPVAMAFNFKNPDISHLRLSPAAMWIFLVIWFRLPV